MRVLVVGGAGFFGRLVVEAVVREPRFDVVAAGRQRPAKALPCDFVRLDITAPGLATRVAAIAPAIVVNCAGPFQPGAYALVQAALSCRSHYLDLAENRRFVTQIVQFDGDARRAGVTVMSGVSSVPALSSAVVAAHRDRFSRLHAIDVGISSSERIPGLGAVRGVLEQCGQPLPASGGSGAASAWTDAFRINLPQPAGKRVMARCDVPDLALFPAHVPELRRVTFRAGLASPWLMRGLRAFARLRRRGWIRRPAGWTGIMAAGAKLFYPFGNGASGMFVRMSGRSSAGSPLVVCWQLVAEDGQGVLVPSRGAVAMASRLAEQSVPPGARACFAELGVAEYLGPAPATVQVDELEGEAACRDELRWSGG